MSKKYVKSCKPSQEQPYILDERLELQLQALENNTTMDVKTKQAQAIAILLKDAEIRDQWFQENPKVIH